MKEISTGIDKEVLDFGLDFNVDLPDEDDDEFKPIPDNERVPEWETEVERYMLISGTLPTNTYLHKHPVPPPRDSDPSVIRKYYLEEIRRCKEGHNGMCGKMYFFFNYCFIQGHGKKGLPHFRVIANEWFKFIEACQKSNNWGIICVKRRRVGASWMEAADVVHDCIFNNNFNVGMNSKRDIDSQILFMKVKFIYENLPMFLRIPCASNTASYLDFSYHVNDAHGTPIRKGNLSTVIAKAPTDSAFEGQLLSKWVCDEAGKIANLAALWRYTEDCLMDDTRRVGMPIVFGTAGDIGKEGRDLEYMWRNSNTYRLKRFFFAGWMGLTADNDPYGNDDREAGIRWIVYERHRKESLRNEDRNVFIQKYPLTVPEAFTVTTDSGIGNIVKIKAQQQSLSDSPPKRVVGAFRFNSQGLVDFYPDPKEKCIIYEHPKPNVESLYIGGCLPPGEKVLTDRGLQNIEEITLQDRLVNKDGEYVKIKELQQYKVKDNLYTLKLKNTYRTTKFTSEHPIYVSDNKKGYTNFAKKKRLLLKYSHQQFNFSYKPVKNVKSLDWIKYPNLYKRVEQIDNKLWPENKRSYLSIKSPLEVIDFWWFIGMWLGNGSSTRGKFYISCNIKEETTIWKICNIIETIFHRSPTLSFKKSNCVDIEFHCTQLHHFLLSNFGKYADGKFIPEWVKFINHNYKKELIAGYLDSDGCIVRDKRRNLYNAEIVSINLGLIESLQDILFSIGIISSSSKLREGSIVYFKDRLISKKAAYRLRISHFWLRELRAINCQSIKISLLPEKLIRTRIQNMGCFFDENKDYIYFQILTIEHSLFQGTVYNFHCETSNYLCRHITTHNCDPADHNEAFSEASDLSLFILRRQEGTDPARIVFEYTDRPNDLTTYYEQAMMALIYYNNAKVLIENNRWGMIGYFEKSSHKFLMARTPANVTRVIGGRSMTYGVRTTEASKKYMVELIRKYIEDFYEFIPSYGLLSEFIYFGSRNTDKVMAFGMAMMLLEDYDYSITEKQQQLLKVPHFGFKNVNGVIKRITYTEAQLDKSANIGPNSNKNRIPGTQGLGPHRTPPGFLK